MSNASFSQTQRTTIGRSPERGSYDRDVAYAILDEGILCHVGLSTDHGPVVIPTTYARRGDELLIHGSPAATWLRAGAKGTPMCVTVTLVDGLVLARSAFHHSMNYRSVVVFGAATRIDDPAERAAALDAVVDHVVPGRSAEVRAHTDEEVAKTLVVSLPLAEASVKVRGHGAVDEDADLDSAAWAGVIPAGLAFGVPVPDDGLDAGVALPPSARDYRRPGTDGAAPSWPRP